MMKTVDAKLCRRATEARSADTAQRDAASLVVPTTRTIADVHREGDEKEARKHTASNLVQAAKGIASIQVLRRAEQGLEVLVRGLGPLRGARGLQEARHSRGAARHTQEAGHSPPAGDVQITEQPSWLKLSKN